MMDWIPDFEYNFGQYEEIKNLKQRNFHGSIEINFCEGIPMNYNLKLHRKAESKPIRKE